MSVPVLHIILVLSAVLALHVGMGSSLARARKPDGPKALLQARPGPRTLLRSAGQFHVPILQFLSYFYFPNNQHSGVWGIESFALVPRKQPNLMAKCIFGTKHVNGSSLLVGGNEKEPDNNLSNMGYLC